VRRRDFITLVGGAAAWPLAARAQSGERVRLVCGLEVISADTPTAEARYPALLEGLQHSGWTLGRNLKIEVRWGGGNEAAAHESMQRNSLHLLRTCLSSVAVPPQRSC